MNLNSTITKPYSLHISWKLTAVTLNSVLTDKSIKYLQFATFTLPIIQLLLTQKIFCVSIVLYSLGMTVVPRGHWKQVFVFFFRGEGWGQDVLRAMWKWPMIDITFEKGHPSTIWNVSRTTIQIQCVKKLNTTGFNTGMCIMWHAFPFSEERKIA